MAAAAGASSSNGSAAQSARPSANVGPHAARDRGARHGDRERSALDGAAHHEAGTVGEVERVERAAGELLLDAHAGRAASTTSSSGSTPKRTASKAGSPVSADAASIARRASSSSGTRRVFRASAITGAGRTAASAPS